MKKVYACLLGDWVCLNDDPKCVMTDFNKSPDLWWEENAPVYSPVSKDPELENSLYGQDYVKITYMGRVYRIHPMFIQILY